MPNVLRVLLAMGEDATAHRMEERLRELGHTVIGVAPDGASTVSMARTLDPDVVLLGTNLGALDWVDAAARMHEERPVAIVLAVAHPDDGLVDRLTTVPIFGLADPEAPPATLGATLAMATARHGAWQREAQRAHELNQRLEDRKVIERAKGILMQREGLSESDAYRMLQRTSQSRNVPMAELSRSLLAAEELISPAPRPAANRRSPTPPR